MHNLIRLLLFAAGVSVSAQVQQGHPPPGHVIDVDGRKLQLNCYGRGSPTVILMAVGGAFSIDWALVRPKIAETTSLLL